MIISGIANPDSFEETCGRFECEIIRHLKFEDHYNYVDFVLPDLNSDFIITTEKDAVKLQTLKLPQKIYTIKMKATIPNSLIEAIEKKMRK